jgi:hypothetical protein
MIGIVVDKIVRKESGELIPISGVDRIICLSNFRFVRLPGIFYILSDARNAYRERQHGEEKYNPVELHKNPPYGN